MGGGGVDTLHFIIEFCFVLVWFGFFVRQVELDKHVDEIHVTNVMQV